MPDPSPITLERVQRAFEMLPPRHQDAFWMLRIDNLSYAEIAERLDITPKRVERLVADSLFRMSRTIEDEERGFRPNLAQRIARALTDQGYRLRRIFRR